MTHSDFTCPILIFKIASGFTGISCELGEGVLSHVAPEVGSVAIC